MVASAEVITADSEKYVEQLLELFRRFSLLVSQVACWISTVFWQMAKPQGFRDDPRFLTSRDKAYKRVVNDTSIFKLDLPSTRLAQSTRGRDGGWPIVENARFYLSFRTGLGSKTTPESKCPELLANYCDMLLRKTPLSKVSIWEDTPSHSDDNKLNFRARHDMTIPFSVWQVMKLRRNWQTCF